LTAKPGSDLLEEDQSFVSWCAKQALKEGRAVAQDAGNEGNGEITEILFRGIVIIIIIQF
jgi:hypothetical protein